MTELSQLLEEYFTIGKCDDLQDALSTAKDNNAKNKAIINSAVRLVTVYNKYLCSIIYEEDFLCSLRNYLLLTNERINVGKKYNRDILEKYGLNEENGIINATFALPSCIKNQEFIENAFLRNLTYEKSEQKFSLLTSPYIYKLTGYLYFKSMSQKLAVNGALNTPGGYTTLVSLPTGGGKSLITQTVAYQNEGMTIVIVPTISLAIDQVRVARSNIKTDNPDEILYYSSGIKDKRRVIDCIKNKKVRLLFISPEALIENQLFVEVVKELNSSHFLKNIIIDEAHIVLDWGGFFRVDYQCLEPWRKKLIAENPQMRTFLLSATFTEDDIELLRKMFSEPDGWIEIRCDELRHEPRFICIKANTADDKMYTAIELVRKLPHPMIVYVSNPYEAEIFKKALERNGLNDIYTFTGKTSAEERNKLIDAWNNNEFDVMIATSAFGVGVDKPDVRTVLHLYVPESPNAYYQELGRGGRDGLPCISAMCVIPSTDLNAAKVTKVLTAEKISGRWLSMLNQKDQVRNNNSILIDTSVKPFYNIESYSDDETGSSIDINWNIYVLLILRRYDRIIIDEIFKKPATDTYIFAIIVKDSRFLKSIEDDEIIDAINDIREAEVNKLTGAYKMISDAVKKSGRDCWSEMFYSTYMKVSEYCAGCDYHSEVIGIEHGSCSLKKPVNKPVKQVSDEMQNYCGNSKEVGVIYDDSSIVQAIEKLCCFGLNVIVSSDLNNMTEFIRNTSNKIDPSIQIMDGNEFRYLLKQRNKYFLSGTFAFIFSSYDQRTMSLFNDIKTNLSLSDENKIYFVHNDKFFDKIGKRFSELIEGPIIPVEGFLN